LDSSPSSLRSAIKECGMHSPFPNRWSPGMSVEQQRALNQLAQQWDEQSTIRAAFNQLAQQWDEQSTIRAAAAGVVQLHRCVTPSRPSLTCAF
jgi:hypothetical protein